MSCGTIGSFSQDNVESTLAEKEHLYSSIKSLDKPEQYDQYAKYFFKSGFSARDFFLHRLKELIFSKIGDWRFFYCQADNYPHMIGVRLSKWDEDHFGFKMATLQVFSNCSTHGRSLDALNTLIKSAISYLKNENVQFVSTRVNGDNLSALHALENEGFRYFDNVIWPITTATDKKISSNVTLMEADQIDVVKLIAVKNQYTRGHYYCDPGFDRSQVDSMYAKWIDTTIQNNEPIAVICNNGQVKGLFVFKIDNQLEKSTGYKYGRLRLLALDSTDRGLGLGESLFRGTLSLISEMGADFIDSGYSTKNHISAKLHTKTSFFSVYEEVTMHLWLK